MIPRLRSIALIATAAGGMYVGTTTEMGRNVVSRGMDTCLDWQEAIMGSTRTVSEENSEYGSNAHHQVERLRQQDPQRYRYSPELANRLAGGSNSAAISTSLVGENVRDAREVLRFDITPDWVMNRFSRVSTVLADMNLEGMRVPFVTGTQVDDMAGTLTYYFDHGNRLQRITAHGFTGDPTRLVKVMTEQYRLVAEPTLEAGVYTRRWNGRPIAFLRLSHAPIVYSDAVHQKYTVFLELNQPDLAYGISQEAQKIVAADRHSGRW